jgi:hypothetical protein
MLTPDRDQLEIFVNGMFRRASAQGFVSLRAFHEGDSAMPFRVTPASLKGGLRFLVDAAMDDAARAAGYPKPVVFCPPLATFSSKERAREKDILEGLVLSVECDRAPLVARAALEAVLGSATFVVHSGGAWIDPETGEAQDKLHLHWRLRAPACGEALKVLKQARDLAARLVGGDPSNKPVCHPIRWPGSWHRKGEPILCSIDTANPGAEIDLSDALAKLKAARSDEPKQKANGKDHFDRTIDAGDDSWEAQVQGIISGSNYHQALTVLAAKMLRAGMRDGAAVNLLRALMESSAGPRDERWMARYADIPRGVSTAREKIGEEEPAASAESEVLLPLPASHG